VLAHGAWSDHTSWRFVVPGFAESFRVITYDRRGHSASERPAGQGSIVDDEDDLAALIESLELAPTHVAGNSSGASIVLRLAARRPELFRDIVVHEPPLFDLLKGDPEAEAQQREVQERVESVVARLEAGDHEGAARQFMEEIAFGPGSWDQLPEQVRQIFVFNAPTFLEDSRDPQELTIDLGSLQEFTAPALLTIGSESPSFFPVVVDRLASALPGAARKTIQGAGHVPQVTHPGAYLESVTPFLAQ
jgi:pimeloyl-ACP methyl ester carboxylesterase